jgi:hypothetical protein
MMAIYGRNMSREDKRDSKLHCDGSIVYELIQCDKISSASVGSEEEL